MSNLLYGICQNAPIEPELEIHFKGGAFGCSDSTSLAYNCPLTQNHVLFSGILDNKKTLCERLNINLKTPLPELISIAYHRWNESLVDHISGDFKTAIWDARDHKLVLINAALSQTNLFYWHKGDSLIFSNSAKQLKALMPEPLKLNPTKIVDLLALSHSNITRDFYQNMHRIPNAYIMTWKAGTIRLKKYWSALDFKKRKSYYTQHKEGIAEFKNRFEQAVADRIEGHQIVASHLSGGLDSSSVSVVAANQLKAQQQPLHAMGVIPQAGFKFPQKPNWNLDDRSKMQAVAEYNGNIDLKLLSPSEFGLSMPDLAKLCVEEACGPCRNPLNALWIYGSFQYAKALNASALLTGQMGNSSISYTGLGASPLRCLASIIKGQLKYWKNPKWWEAFSLVRPEALEQHRTTPPGFIYGGRNQHNQLADILASGISDAAGFYGALSHRFNVDILDPTAAQPVFEHCLKLPDHYFVRNKERRLLIRDAMESLLPDSTRLDNSRGEQHADWYFTLKGYTAHYEELLPEFEKHDLIPELIDLVQLRKLLASVKHTEVGTENAKSLMIQFRLKLARSLHIAEWVYLSSKECS